MVRPRTARVIRGALTLAIMASPCSAWANEPTSPAPAEPVEEEPTPPTPPIGEPTPPTPTPTTTDEERERELAELRTRLDTLEAEVRALRTAPARKPTPTSPKKAIKAAPAGDQRDPTGGIAPGYADGFHFGSYGRVVAGADHRGHPGRDADIVARGSRLDESTYAELELRREDYWEQTGAYTRIVATVAFRHPIFHYDGRFDSQLGVRNLYIEESGLGLKHLKVWAGSRMYRGDDIYLLDFWPLDNLNTVGGGASYEFVRDLVLKLHAGINQPNNAFFLQEVERPRPLDQPGATTVRITDRQRFIGSAKLSHILRVGKDGGGIKPVVYGEVHYTGAAQREVESRQFQNLPDDVGFLVGTQLGLFTGKRSTHVNLVFRYAGGLAAYGELNAPFSLSPERTSKGAREILVALSGNYEVGPFGLLLGAYWRQFRDASPALDYGDLGEGIAIVRPTVWFGKVAGLSLEGSYQAQRRGVLVEREDGATTPVFGHMGRVGVVPFLTPSGRGSYARPHLRLIYLLTARNSDARLLYAQHDPFSLRKLDHFIGIGAEWWFGSTSYFRE